MPKKKKTKRAVPTKPKRTKRVAARSVSKKKKKPVKATKKPQGNGKFAKGNTAGKGKTTPEAKHKMALATAFKSAVTESDMVEIVQGLLIKAKAGDVKAAKEILDRCLGKAVQPISGEDGGPVQMEMRIIDYKDIDDSE